MKVNSFFCGAGGLDLGFIQAGHEIVGAWDYDKYAVESYAANIGSHVKQADVREMKGEEIPQADIWTFGFPCQDVSQAMSDRGKGMIKGITRTGLFYEIMRLLGEVDRKPLFIVAENVPGLKKYLDTVEYEFNMAGYRFNVNLFNSKYFGLPQSRERYFMIGVREDLAVDFIFPKQNEESVPRLKSVLLDESLIEDRYFVSSDKAMEIIEKAKNGQLEYLNQKRSKINVLGRAEGIKGHDLIKRVYDVNGLSPTLNTCEGGNRQPKILIVGSLKPDHVTRSGYRDEVWDSEGIAGTVNASDHKQPRPVLHDYKIRKLVPREYARLQGFPDTYKQVVSNSQFYKQMGNAVSVPVAKAIGEALNRL